MNIEDYSKYYIQGSDHYLIPKNEFIELFNEMLSWKNESKKQKEVINKAIEYIENCNPDAELHSMFLNESYLSNYGAVELLNILQDKEVSE